MAVTGWQEGEGKDLCAGPRSAEPDGFPVWLGPGQRVVDRQSSGLPLCIEQPPLRGEPFPLTVALLTQNVPAGRITGEPSTI